MKTNYLLAVLFVFGMITTNAQYALDDMESYEPCGSAITAPWLAPYLSSIMIASCNQAQSGIISAYVDGSGIDPFILLGDKLLGSWGVKFSMYIPTGKIGYWNIQGQEDPGIQWVVGNITFGFGLAMDDEMTGRIDLNTADPADDITFQFPKDQWFDIVMNFDFNLGAGASTWTMWVNNVEVVAPDTPFADGSDPPVYAQALGGINLFSYSTDMEMYIDDLEYINDFYPDPSLGVNYLDAKKFSAYPNPVKNGLNIIANEEMSSVVIFSVLGQEVYNVNISALTATIDMSSFANGAYFVKVNVGGTEGIVKVLK